MPPARLEPAAPRSRAKLSTTESLCSLGNKCSSELAASMHKKMDVDENLDWPQSLMSIFSKTDILSKIAIYKLYLEVEVLGLDIRFD